MRTYDSLEGDYVSENKRAFSMWAHPGPLALKTRLFKDEPEGSGVFSKRNWEWHASSYIVTRLREERGHYLIAIITEFVEVD